MVTVSDKRMLRLGFWMWLFHPIQSYWIRFLVKEAIRQQEGQAQRTSLTNGEWVVAKRAVESSRKEVRAALRKLSRIELAQKSALEAAQKERRLAGEQANRLLTPRTRNHSIVIPPLTSTEARELLVEQRAKIEEDLRQGGTRHLDAPSTARRGTAYALLGVDVLAIFTAFATVFNLDLANFDFKEVATTGGFSVIAALVLGQLAHSTGHLMWQGRITAVAQPSEESEPSEEEAPAAERSPGAGGTADGERSGEFPKSRSMLIAKLLGLFVVSALSGVSILTRVVEEADKIGSSGLGWVLGLLAGVAAFVAPWLVVIDEMRSGSLETRTVDALTKMVQEVDEQASALTASADKHDAEAADLARRAEGAVDGVGDEPTRESSRAQKIIYTARSLHGAAGRNAAEGIDEADEDQTRDVLADYLRSDTTSLRTVLGRIRSSDGKPGPKPFRAVDDAA